MAALTGRRVVIIGTTGAGKTTLASRLAALLEVPHIELDALHWGPGWIAAETERFRALATEHTAGPAWVVEGNYRAVRDIVWGRADTLVWLDYAYPVVLARLFRRTMRRGLTGQRLYNSNVESLRTHFLTRDSLFLWQVKSHWRRRREYPGLFQEPAYRHLQVVRLRTPRAAARWLGQVAAEVAANG